MNKKFDRVEIKDEITTHLAEHEILLSFFDDDGAYSFSEWFEEEGKILFQNWLRKQDTSEYVLEQRRKNK